MDGTGHLLEVHRREMRELEQQTAELVRKRREEEAYLDQQFEEFRRMAGTLQPAQDSARSVFFRAYAVLAAMVFAALILGLS